jgi:DNA modification methylase
MKLPSGVTLRAGDALATLRTVPDESVHCIVTSPPYWGLRDYRLKPLLWDDGWRGAFGLEPTPQLYVQHCVAIFREARRVLRDDGTLWLNMGDSYNQGPKGQGSLLTRRGKRVGPNRSNHQIGLKPKDLIGLPWRVAFALQADGWWLRTEIIWHKKNPMPESVRDRPTRAHEYLFLFAKSARYYYDAAAIQEPASENTHRRISQVNLPQQQGGSKTELYQQNFVKKNRDRKPVEIIQALARKYGINPKAASAWPHTPSGWDTGPGSHRELIGRYKPAGKNSRIHQDRDPRHPSARKIKQNPSFAAACSQQVVLHRNKRTVWTLETAPYRGAHFATYPPKLIEPCILAGCPPGGVVLDPFAGSGTTGAVALALGRRALLIELNPRYLPLIRQRLARAPT